MKRYNHLYIKITAFENLYSAAKKAEKGKRFQPEVANFNHQLEANLLALQSELETKTYQPSTYKSFYVHVPKKRMISVAPYRDRVVHHALCNVVMPLFEKSFIEDTYANRKGKGTHAAILRYQGFAKQYKYVLKCDIRKFFPSIDHDILKTIIRKKIKCQDTLLLINRILNNSNEQEAHQVYFEGDSLFTPFERRKGLPIGNLTSQWFGNIYLNEFDHFIKNELGIKGYVRYVDDFVICGNCKKALSVIKNKIIQFLGKYRLTLHTNKSQIHQTERGIPFLGFRIFPYYKTVCTSSKNRYRRNIRRKVRLKNKRQLSPQQLEDGLNSWLGHIRFGNNYRLEQEIFKDLRNRFVSVHIYTNLAWRVLEYIEY
ncbi:MAG: reverse transcriptase domain-containing protein [Saprospiraceae bacterium]